MRNLGDERNAVFFNLHCDSLLTPRFSERFLKSCSEARLDRSWRRRHRVFMAAYFGILESNLSRYQVSGPAPFVNVPAPRFPF